MNTTARARARNPRIRGYLAALLCLASAACDRHAAEAHRSPARSFDDVFDVVWRVHLEEAADDVITDIGAFREAGNGDLLISEVHRPRVRRYDSAGTLIAEFGTFGEGPLEFRRIAGIVEDSAGRVVAIDPVLGRAAILGADLRPDTMFRLPVRPRTGVEPLAGGLLLNAASGARASALVFLSTTDWMPVWNLPAPSPGSMAEYPYWGSIARIPFVTATREFVVAYSLLYPIRIHATTGEVVDSLPRPRSFREASRVRAGTFNGPGAAERLERWIESFDVIADLAVVDDTLLVVTHGALSSTPTNRNSVSHSRLDVYHLPSRTRIAEDIPLPPESRVLGGGRGLYLLTAQPPDPWTISRVRLTENEPNR